MAMEGGKAVYGWLIYVRVLFKSRNQIIKKIKKLSIAAFLVFSKVTAFYSALPYRYFVGAAILSLTFIENAFSPTK